MMANVSWGQTEIGSMLHWETEFPLPVWGWPKPAVYYSLCRHALEALCRMQPNRPTLWLPSFFCVEVARHCRAVANIREYSDNCCRSEPDWSTLHPAAEDLVLGVNYFGVRSAEPWNAWRQRNACVLVEDHTQDPFSNWARNSVADYALCSIRKTVPVPDGALLWSPKQRPLPDPPQQAEWDGSCMKAGAMLYKREYLSAPPDPRTKERFRELQLLGEDRLNRSECSRMSPVSESILSRGVPMAWREKRVANTVALLEELAKPREFHLVFETWPEEHAPFGLPLVFEGSSDRDRFQHALRKKEIYCPVEWVCETDDKVASDLSSRILSIPTDHRYSENDMKKIAGAIKIACVSRAGT